MADVIQCRDWLGFSRDWEGGVCGVTSVGLNLQKEVGSITVMSITSGRDGSAAAWTVLLPDWIQGDSLPSSSPSPSPLAAMTPTSTSRAMTKRTSLPAPWSSWRTISTTW